MNNRMSYNDVQQLKNLIRQRLQEVAGVPNGTRPPYGMPNGPRPPYGMPNNPGQISQVANGRIAQANNRVVSSMQQGETAYNRPPMQQPVSQGQRPMQQPMVQGQQPMQSQAMRPQPMQPQTMRPQPVKGQPKRPQPVKAQPKAADNATPPLDRQVAKHPAKPQGGAYFDKYDCGHPYPKMSVRQHLKEDMGKSRSERVDNLRYAYVMSEILSEPVCKRRRRYLTD